jgi:hypothetical protein
MDIAAWLRGLGLERYEADFRDNEIDWAVLPQLTSDDLNSNPYDQTEVIDHIKAELNVVAGQWVRRKVGNLSPEEQDAIINSNQPDRKPL